jgi:hypothetical protein
MTRHSLRVNLITKQEHVGTAGHFSGVNATYFNNEKAKSLIPRCSAYVRDIAYQNVYA